MSAKNILLTALIEEAEGEFSFVQQKLETIAQEFANRFHEDVLQPFCRRHKLLFISGMGTWFFEAPNGKQLDSNSFNNNSIFADNLWRIEDQLHESFMGVPFGFWVGDFDGRSG